MRTTAIATTAAALVMAGILSAQEPPVQGGRGGRGRGGGPNARGAGGPNLLRSETVLHDDRGELIGPVIQKGRAEKGMPPMPGTTPSQIAEISEYLHLLVERAANRGLYGTLYSNDVVTGGVRAGETYFNGAGGCRACHSPAPLK